MYRTTINFTGILLSAGASNSYAVHDLRQQVGQLLLAGTCLPAGHLRKRQVRIIIPKVGVLARGHFWIPTPELTL